MNSQELLHSLKEINASCRQALIKRDFYRLKLLFQLKKEIFELLKDASLSTEDLPLLRELLTEEKSLAGIVLKMQKRGIDRILYH